MNCAACREYLLQNAMDSLPEPVSAHLLECADCRAAHTRAVTLVRLLSLKQHETPDVHFETRLVARVESAIREGAAAPQGIGARIWDMLAGGPLPALRFSMALVVVGLIGLNLLSVQTPPSLPFSSIEAKRPAPAPLMLASEESTNRLPNRSLPVVFLPAATPPSNVQYGTGPSRLVGFEY
jgi:hypothetical protein